MSTKQLTIPELVDRYTNDVMSLSPQQRSFILEYIAGGLANGKYDAKAAARTAYPNVEKIGIWANRLLVNRRIKRILLLQQGLTEYDIVFGELQTLIQKSQRKGAKPSKHVAGYLRVAAALEAIAKEKNS